MIKSKIKTVMNSENNQFVDFKGTSIVKSEADALIELEKVAGYIEIVSKINSQTVCGVIIKDNHAVGLSLNYARLTYVPESITQLTTLKELYLNGNRLKELPESIGKLSSLTVLNIGNNSLDILPDSIEKLASLKKLYIGGNNIFYFSGMRYLTELTHLDVSDNKFDDLKGIEDLKSLEYVAIDGNEFYSSRDDVTFTTMSEAVIRHLKDLEQRGCRVDGRVPPLR